MEKPKIAFIKFNSNLMSDYELKVGEALVYGALVSFRNMSIKTNTTDEKGQVYAYPPIASIANSTGQSERSVKSHIQVLEQKGLMTVTRSYKKGSKQKNVNRYYLNSQVLGIYFNEDPTKSDSSVKPKTTKVKDIHKEKRQKEFIADSNIEKWFTHYKGEHNTNSAKKLNELVERYGTETVVKAIHNAMDGVNIDTLPQGSTGLILSRLNDKNLESTKRQLQNEKEKSERFFSEPITPPFDYKEALRKQKEEKEVSTFDDNVKALLGEVI